MSAPNTTVTLRTRKFFTNRLLSRKQMIVEVIHPGRPNVSKSELREKLAALYKVDNPNRVSLFGFSTKFGGGRSTGFALIYDNMEAVTKFEPKYRQVRSGLTKREQTGRKQRKERKNRAKKVRGATKHKASAAAKKK